jgi:hypothetical protein
LSLIDIVVFIIILAIGVSCLYAGWIYTKEKHVSLDYHAFSEGNLTPESKIIFPILGRLIKITPWWILKTLLFVVGIILIYLALQTYL